MTKQTGVYSTTSPTRPKLAEAVEAYVAQGGVISVVPEGETGRPLRDNAITASDPYTTLPPSSKLEQLKELVAKGAGVSAIQYSLRMNRQEIKRLANENGVKIHFSRPMRASRLSRHHDVATVDDTVAGHAMHYSSLGYTVPEIAQLLELSVRDVLNLGKAYRFEFKHLSIPGVNESEKQTSACRDERRAGTTRSTAIDEPGKWRMDGQER